VLGDISGPPFGLSPTLVPVPKQLQSQENFKKCSDCNSWKTEKVEILSWVVVVVVSLSIKMFLKHVV